MTAPSQKIGLYGGSFDPIHFGHLRPVREAREALGLDRVLYLPTARPPHKAGGGGARLGALRDGRARAAAASEGCASRDFEMRRRA